MAFGTMVGGQGLTLRFAESQSFRLRGQSWKEMMQNNDRLQQSIDYSNSLTSFLLMAI
jgi:hypothetical protein